MTLASNHHFPRHSHDQFGVGVITFGGHRSWSGIGQVDAVAGDVIMVNPGEIHDGAPMQGESRGWRMIYLEPSLLPRAVEVIYPVARDPLLARHFNRLFAALSAPQPDLLAAEQNLLYAVVSLLTRHSTAPPALADRSPCVAKALDSLDSAPELPVSLAELAALSGVSRFQLLRGFAREVGITPHAYLTQRRVRLARQLLAKGQTPSQAALLAGFADQSHLTRAFVRQFGITPSRYRAAAISF
jgi:AraC-like DNA-binding protein